MEDVNDILASSSVLNGKKTSVEFQDIAEIVPGQIIQNMIDPIRLDRSVMSVSRPLLILA